LKQLRVGLVGAGLVGQAEHAFYLWEERERFAFVALADASAAVRKAVGARYGIKELYPDMKGLLTAKLDAVVIAAPDPFHPSLAVAALDAGLHVMCEKPLALTLAGCDAIAAAAKRAKRVVRQARGAGRLYEALRPSLPPGARFPAQAHPGREMDFRRGERSRPESLCRPSADDHSRRHSR
jgi:predicted dinucleotide-utilizing enzyme